MKKVFMVPISLILLFCMLLSGCGAGKPVTPATAGVDKNLQAEIAAAAKKLNDTYTNYVIETSVDRGDSYSMFIEVVKGDDIYTEYSVSGSEDYEFGMIPYGSDDVISYTITDWTHDGKYYSFNTDENGESVIYRFPDKFAEKYAYDREMLWVNRMLATAESITKHADVTLEDEVLTAYNIRVPAETVAELMSYDSRGVYQAIKDEEKAGSNIAQLCDLYLWNMADSHTYSAADAVVAIDSNGILRVVTMKIGGLGQIMYVTKQVVATTNPNVRDDFDFSVAVPFTSTLSEMADYIVQFDTNEEKITALSELFASYDYDLGLEPDLGVIDDADSGSDVEE